MNIGQHIQYSYKHFETNMNEGNNFPIVLRILLLPDPTFNIFAQRTPDTRFYEQLTLFHDVFRLQ